MDHGSSSSSNSPVPSKAALIQNQLLELELRLRVRREKLTLYQKPFHTMCIFCLASYSYIKILLKYLLLHPVFLYIIAPVVSIWFLSEFFPGPYTDFINKIEFYIEFFVWWLGLGILSSIGFGSGLQTGVLFLFPHIIRVCLAAQTCKTLEFEANTNMWFRRPKNLFMCPSDPLAYSTPVTFYGTWLKILPVCFLQAAGTALGEIPPYWITRSARLAGHEAVASGAAITSDLPEELEVDTNPTFFNRAKLAMIRLLRVYGFYGVLLMASFPNIAFDICGIYCGHYLMPFWTFFGATFLGKAVIRNGYQSVMYVALCSEAYLEMIIQLLQYLTPDYLHCDKIIREILEEGRASFHQGVNGASPTQVGSKRDKSVPSSGDTSNRGHSYAMILMFWWQVFMMVILLSFLLSCVAQFAQYHQMTIDTEEIAKLKQKLLSSSSGNISVAGTPFTSPLAASTASVRSLRPTSHASGYSTSYSPPPAHLYTASGGLGASISPALLGSGSGIQTQVAGSGAGGGGGSAGAGASGQSSLARSSFVATLSSALSGEAQSKSGVTEHGKGDASSKRE